MQANRKPGLDHLIRAIRADNARVATLLNSLSGRIDHPCGPPPSASLNERPLRKGADGAPDGRQSGEGEGS